MTDIVTLEAQLESLRNARATGAKRVKFGDGRETEFMGDAELAAAIADIERRIAAASGRKTPRIVNVRSNSGW